MPIARENSKAKVQVLHSFFLCITNYLLQTCNYGYSPLYKIEIALVPWRVNMLLFLHKGILISDGALRNTNV